MNKGDIVLIPFPFTDLLGNKNRPTVILFDSKEDVTVCFLTTQIKCQSAFDITIEPSDLNGLKKKSLVRLNKFASIDKDLVIGRLGELDDHSISLLNKNLIELLKLG
jgi:mRNA interferase MazF